MHVKKEFNYFYDPQARMKEAFEPSWKNRVDRWYQLDENAFALCEALSAWELPIMLRNHNQSLSQIIYMSEGASNLADADFVNSDALSPSKFVYTLPNIAISVGLQILEWRGPVYSFCISKDDERTKNQITNRFIRDVNAKGLCSLVITLGAGLNPEGYRAVNGLVVF